MQNKIDGIHAHTSSAFFASNSSTLVCCNAMPVGMILQPLRIPSAQISRIHLMRLAHNRIPVFCGRLTKNSRNFRLIDHIISLSRRGKLNLNSLHTIYFSFFFSLFSNSEVCARCCHELYALYVCKQLNFLLSEWKRKYELKNVNWIVLRAKSNWSRHRSLCFIWNENKMFLFLFFIRSKRDFLIMAHSGTFTKSAKRKWKIASYLIFLHSISLH